MRTLLVTTMSVRMSRRMRTRASKFKIGEDAYWTNLLQVQTFFNISKLCLGVFVRVVRTDGINSSFSLV